MIVNFSVQNFSSIKDKQTLSFEADRSKHLEDYYIIHSKTGLRLLKLGLIYGANASGKTSVLKALDFLRSLVLLPEDKKTDLLAFEPFLFDPHTPKLPSSLSIEFIQNDVRYLYEVEFTKRAILNEALYNYNPSKASVFKRVTDTEKQFSEIEFGSKISIDKSFKKTLEANTLWNNTVLGGFLKTNIELHELKEVTDWFSKYLSPLVQTNSQLDDYITAQIDTAAINKSDVVSILKKADFNISDIIIKDSKEQLEIEHSIDGFRYSLPFSLESQGTQRYYGFAGLVSLLIRDSIAIPIDELESSLHPDLFNHFLLSFLINSKSSQLIATTHNREILNNKDVFRNDAIWFTNKNEVGATELYALSDFDTSVVRDTSNIYNAYKVGKLGGVPHLGDYYIDLGHEN